MKHVDLGPVQIKCPIELTLYLGSKCGKFMTKTDGIDSSMLFSNLNTVYNNI